MFANNGELTPPTAWNTSGLRGLGIGLRSRSFAAWSSRIRRRRRGHPVDDRGSIGVNLHTCDKLSDQVAPLSPSQSLDSGPHALREPFEVRDHRAKRARIGELRVRFCQLSL